MRKSYKKLIIFEAIFFLFLIMNSFISSILSNYKYLVLFVLLIVFKFILGFEKDKNRHTKDVIYDTIIYLLIFFILFYLLGIYIGYARAEDYYNWYGFKTFIFPVIMTVILKEFLRYNILRKVEQSKAFMVITCILFIFFDISSAIAYNDFSNNYETFLFVAITLLPAISANVAYTYISYNAGYKPVIIYSLVMSLYQYLIPIVPNPSEYLYSNIQLILPALLAYKEYTYFKKEKDEEISRDYKKSNVLYLIVPTVVTVILVYFTSGYFHYYAVAIATGSMDPVIKKGDVAIIEKTKDYGSINEGQIIAFQSNNIMIVHRVIRKVKTSSGYYFYTKGDANNAEDGYPVTQEMILGKVNVYIPYIGLPTVWLKEL